MNPSSSPILPEIYNPALAEIEGRVSNFVALARSLINLIQEENALLEARRIKDIAPLIPEKSRLTAAYIREMEILKKRKSSLGDENSPLRIAIRDVTDELAGLIVDHGRLLNRLKTMTENIVDVIKQEAARQAHPAAGYNANARMAVPSAVPTTLAYNASI